MILVAHHRSLPRRQCADQASRLSEKEHSDDGLSGAGVAHRPAALWVVLAFPESPLAVRCASSILPQSLSCEPVPTGHRIGIDVERGRGSGMAKTGATIGRGTPASSILRCHEVPPVVEPEVIETSSVAQ